jgi:hypothetical protein
MTMADVFGITLFHAGILIVLPGTWLLYGALFPKALERGQGRLRRTPFRTFFAGLAVGLAIVAATAALGQAGLQVPAGLLGVAGAGFALFGISPLAAFVGSRVTAPSDTPWRSHARGGVILLLPCMIPFLGWFALFPIVLALGVGAGTTSLFAGRRAEASGGMPAIPGSAVTAPLETSEAEAGA